MIQQWCKKCKKVTTHAKNREGGWFGGSWYWVIRCVMCSR